MRARPSDGNEPFVRRVEAVTELPGRHSELVDRALTGAERFVSGVYLPRWRGSRGPFGFRARPASHALVLTDQRLVVSADPHRPEESPRVASIALGEVLAIEVGRALLQAWFLVRFAQDRAEDSAFFFYRSTGCRHVEALVRQLRELRWEADARPDEERSRSWDSVRSELQHLSRLLPLVTQEEQPLAWLRARAEWTRGGRLWRPPRCLLPESEVVLTNAGVFRVVVSPPVCRAMTSFAVNVICLPHAALRDLRLEPLRMEESSVRRCLRVSVGTPHTQFELRWPYHEGEEAAVLQSGQPGFPSPASTAPR
ncbi:MAG: hypothetical protein GW892_15655 [Armatimonadetes bacterium]|nr:hypothetical protein [Armatimonadota bacterium]